MSQQKSAERLDEPTALQKIIGNEQDAQEALNSLPESMEDVDPGVKGWRLELEVHPQDLDVVRSEIEQLVNGGTR